MALNTYWPAIIQCLSSNFAALFSENLFPTFSSFLIFHNFPTLTNSQHPVTNHLRDSSFFPPANLQTHLHLYLPTTFPLVTMEVSAPKGPFFEIWSPYHLLQDFTLSFL